MIFSANPSEIVPGLIASVTVSLVTVVEYDSIKLLVLDMFKGMLLPFETVTLAVFSLTALLDLVSAVTAKALPSNLLPAGAVIKNDEPSGAPVFGVANDKPMSCADFCQATIQSAEFDCSSPLETAYTST